MVTQVLAAAFTGSPLAWRPDPTPMNRQQTALGYVGGLVQTALTSGIVRIARNGDEVVGAALWSPFSRPCQPARAAHGDQEHESGGKETRKRRGLLDRFADGRLLPTCAFQQLVCIGVKPQLQGRGGGSRLLIDHHAFLHLIDTPAFAVVTGGRMQGLLERHGYTAIGPPELLPGAVLASAMWRPPGPADPR
jgi:hypothetical protein